MAVMEMLYDYDTETFYTIDMFDKTYKTKMDERKERYACERDKDYHIKRGGLKLKERKCG